MEDIKNIYNLTNDSYSIKTMSNGDNIETFYNISTYKLKVVNVDNDAWNFFPIIKNGNAYLRIDNKYSDDYVTVMKNNFL